MSANHNDKVTGLGWEDTPEQAAHYAAKYPRGVPSEPLLSDEEEAERLDAEARRPRVSLREQVRRQIASCAREAASKEHERGYETLYARRYGNLRWYSAPNKQDEVIDDYSDRFEGRLQPLPSLIKVGCGDIRCDCDYCRKVAPDYTGADAYDNQAQAIRDAVDNADLSYMIDQMDQELDAIPVGYFEDEHEQ